MRKSSIKSPSFLARDDVSLNRHGLPDTLIIIRGHKLHAHSAVLGQASPILERKLTGGNIDPFFGRTVYMSSSEHGERTLEGVLAFLCLIYPPQVQPPPELFPEVDSICREYKMDVLLSRLKFSVTASCDFRDLAEAEQRAAELGGQQRFDLPEVFFESLSEFGLDSAKAMPGFQDLSHATRAEVLRRRIGFLEQKFHHEPALRECKALHAELFKDCPLELDIERLEQAFFSEGIAGADCKEVSHSRQLADRSDRTSLPGNRNLTSTAGSASGSSQAVGRGTGASAARALSASSASSRSSAAAGNRRT
eukprot:TRINITY_DN9112_c0_g1_i2.p1 TRINITY_DN9112_c0_g1~~TRINITY_DN9112_c0_g1_i2.p1  ORF type:complete len:308 (-),score=42.82 TRINITY_DN9112_c0_g1_i2:264-1187(-)